MMTTATASSSKKKKRNKKPPSSPEQKVTAGFPVPEDLNDVLMTWKKDVVGGRFTGKLLHKVAGNLVSHRQRILLVSKGRGPGVLTADTGCNRCVAGRPSHKAMVKYLAKYGLKPVKYNKVEEFIFGNDQTEKSDAAFVYPCVFEGNFACGVDIARIDPDCPALASKALLKKWEADISFKNNTMTLEKYNHTVPFTSNVPLVDILDLGPPEAFDRTKVPKCFWLESNEDPEENGYSYDTYVALVSKDGLPAPETGEEEEEEATASTPTVEPVKEPIDDTSMDGDDEIDQGELMLMLEANPQIKQAVIRAQRKAASTKDKMARRTADRKLCMSLLAAIPESPPPSESSGTSGCPELVSSSDSMEGCWPVLQPRSSSSSDSSD
jgi:hypothetical protein